MCSICADPYLNTDAGTMSPFEHGEVFVLDDGGEVNLLNPFFPECGYECKPKRVLTLSLSYDWNHMD